MQINAERNDVEITEDSEKQEESSEILTEGHPLNSIIQIDSSTFSSEQKKSKELAPLFELGKKDVSKTKFYIKMEF